MKFKAILLCSAVCIGLISGSLRSEASPFTEMPNKLTKPAHIIQVEGEVRETGADRFSKRLEKLRKQEEEAAGPQGNVGIDEYNSGSGLGAEPSQNKENESNSALYERLNAVEQGGEENSAAREAAIAEAKRIKAEYAKIKAMADKMPPDKRRMFMQRYQDKIRQDVERLRNSAEGDHVDLEGVMPKFKEGVEELWRD